MKKIIAFFIDALGPDLITPDAMPFLCRLMKENPHYEMSSILGYSGAIHPSIWTSTYPEEHNKWSTVIRSQSPKKGLKDSILGNLPDAVSRPANYLLHYSRLSRSSILPSISPKHIQFFSKSDYDYYHAVKEVNGIRTLFSFIPAMYHFYNSVENITPIINSKSELDVYFTGHLDHFSHLHLASLGKMKGLLRKIDSKLQEMFSFYKMRFPGCHFIVFSDHGQDIIKKRVDVKSAVEPLGLKFGTDYIAAYDSTMARFWVFNEKAKMLIGRAMSNIGYGTVLDKKARQKYGIGFKHNIFGDIFFLLKPGCEIYPNFYHNYLKNNVQGMHGYIPESRGMKAFFLYSGPCSLAKGSASVLDIAPTMLELLGRKIPRHMRGKSLCR
ncbi:hypothetical protein HY638_01790 [Candidatus Woesearchaeota archaeon]|nr:hypothetical protein [Candidatus Woesearchaeota archaeon]